MFISNHFFSCSRVRKPNHIINIKYVTSCIYSNKQAYHISNITIYRRIVLNPSKVNPMKNFAFNWQFNNDETCYKHIICPDQKTIAVYSLSLNSKRDEFNKLSPHNGSIAPKRQSMPWSYWHTSTPNVVKLTAYHGYSV